MQSATGSHIALCWVWAVDPVRLWSASPAALTGPLSSGQRLDAAEHRLTHLRYLSVKECYKITLIYEKEAKQGLNQYRESPSLFLFASPVSIDTKETNPPLQAFPLNPVVISRKCSSLTPQSK